MLKLHEEMFGNVSEWSGELRKIDLNLGVVSYQVPIEGKWLAFQLLETGELLNGVSRKCMEVIEEMAAGDRGDALGAPMWLRAAMQTCPCAERPGPDR